MIYVIESVYYTSFIVNDLCMQGRFRGGGKGASVPPSNTFYLHVTSTINSMKISFNDV